MSEEPRMVLLEGGLSRRDLLRRIGAAVVVAGNCTFSLEAAEHVHKLARQEKTENGRYTPKLLNAREYQMLERLSELIIPADEKSGSAKEAGAPEFIDLLCSQNDELADIYTGGLLWLDLQSERRFETRFLDASEEDQVGLLEMLNEEARRLDALRYAERGADFGENSNFGGFKDYRSVPRGELGPGARFFVWLRRMVVDAFYTSPLGIADVDFQGNEFLSEYTVPETVLEFIQKVNKDND